MLGFGPIGTLPVAGGPATINSIVLHAASGSFTLTGNSSSFAISEAANVGSFTLTGVSDSFSINATASPGSYALKGASATMYYITSQGGAFQINAFQRNAFQTDTNAVISNIVLEKPINCVLMGQQLYDRSERTAEISPFRPRRKVVASAAGTLNSGLSSFSVKQSNRGYD